MTTQEFIEKRKHLVWYVKNTSELDDKAIVEAVLNYGNWEDVQGIIEILGIKKVSKIFKEQLENMRCNYFPEIKNYFSLYFNKYAK